MAFKNTLSSQGVFKRFAHLAINEARAKYSYRRRLRRAVFFTAFRVVFFAVFLFAALRFGAFFATLRFATLRRGALRFGAFFATLRRAAFRFGAAFFAAFLLFIEL